MNKVLYKQFEELKQAYDEVFAPVHSKIAELESKISKANDIGGVLANEHHELTDKRAYSQARIVKNKIDANNVEIDDIMLELGYYKELLHRPNMEMSNKLLEISKQLEILNIAYQEIYLAFQEEQRELNEEIEKLKIEKMATLNKKYCGDLEAYRQTSPIFLGEYYFKML